MATKKQKRRRFTPEYKKEVVALVQKGGKNLTALLSDNYISPTTTTTSPHF